MRTEGHNIDSKKIEENGWLQGAVFLVDEDNRVDSLSQGFYAVLSQDCSILNSSLDNEPSIEVITLEKLEKCDPAKMHAKQPRFLDLETPKGNFTLKPNSRFFIPRIVLLDMTPRFYLDKQSTKTLITWITERYTRPAFPDEFNKRRGPFLKKIKRIMEGEGSRALALLVSVQPKEDLPEDEDYLVSAILVIDRNASDSEYLELANAYENLANVFSQIPKIKFDHSFSGVRSSAELLVSEILEYKKLEVDYISISNSNSGGRTLPI